MLADEVESCSAYRDAQGKGEIKVGVDRILVAQHIQLARNGDVRVALRCRDTHPQSIDGQTRNMLDVILAVEVNPRQGEIPGNVRVGIVRGTRIDRRAPDPGPSTRASHHAFRLVW